MSTPQEKITQGLTTPPGVEKIQAAFGRGADTRKPVYDGQGKVIGYDAPPPPPGPTAGELIQEGFRQNIVKAEGEITEIVQEMAAIAREARTTADRASQWDFRSRLAAEQKRAELKAKFEDAKNRLREPRNYASQGGPSPIVRAADAFIGNLSRHFEDEGPGPLNRF